MATHKTPTSFRGLVNHFVTLTGEDPTVVVAAIKRALIRTEIDGFSGHDLWVVAESRALGEWLAGNWPSTN